MDQTLKDHPGLEEKSHAIHTTKQSLKSLTSLEQYLFEIGPNIEKTAKLDELVGLTQLETSEVNRFSKIYYLRIKHSILDKRVYALGLGTADRPTSMKPFSAAFGDQAEI